MVPKPCIRSCPHAAHAGSIFDDFLKGGFECTQRPAPLLPLAPLRFAAALLIPIEARRAPSCVLVVWGPAALPALPRGWDIASPPNSDNSLPSVPVAFATPRLITSLSPATRLPLACAAPSLLPLPFPAAIAPASDAPALLDALTGSLSPDLETCGECPGVSLAQRSW